MGEGEGGDPTEGLRCRLVWEAFGLIGTGLERELAGAAVCTDCAALLVRLAFELGGIEPEREWFFFGAGCLVGGEVLPEAGIWLEGVAFTGSFAEGAAGMGTGLVKITSLVRLCEMGSYSFVFNVVVEEIFSRIVFVSEGASLWGILWEYARRNV